jgi:hypothetical protein
MELLPLDDDARHINNKKMIHLYNEISCWNTDLFEKDDIDLSIVNKYGLMWYYIKSVLKIDPLYDIERFKTFDETMLRTLDYNDWKIIFTLGKFTKIVGQEADKIINANTKYDYIVKHDKEKIIEYSCKKFGEYVCDIYGDGIYDVFRLIKDEIETTKLFNETELIGYIYKVFPYINNIGVALETLIIIIHNHKKYDINEKDIYKLENICEEIQTLFYSTIHFCYSHIELNENILFCQINIFFSKYDNKFYKLIDGIINKDIKTIIELI